MSGILTIKGKGKLSAGVHACGRIAASLMPAQAINAGAELVLFDSSYPTQMSIRCRCTSASTKIFPCSGDAGICWYRGIGFAGFAGFADLRVFMLVVIYVFFSRAEAELILGE